MPHEENQELFKDLDEICVGLIEAEAWHARASTECRNIGVIGWAKWHHIESMTHKHCLDKLTKTLQTQLDYAPQLNLKRLDKINDFEMNDLDEFIQHHFEWIEKTKNFNEALTIPIQESKKINRELHKQLELLEEEAQHQIALVKKVYKRIKFAGFLPHDIGVVSKWIEDYFDYEYCLGDKICFNIG